MMSLRSATIQCNGTPAGWAVYQVVEGRASCIHEIMKTGFHDFFTEEVVPLTRAAYSELAGRGLES